MRLQRQRGSTNDIAQFAQFDGVMPTRSSTRLDSLLPFLGGKALPDQGFFFTTNRRRAEGMELSVWGPVAVSIEVNFFLFARQRDSILKILLVGCVVIS